MRNIGYKYKLYTMYTLTESTEIKTSLTTTTSITENHHQQFSMNEHWVDVFGRMRVSFML